MRKAQAKLGQEFVAEIKAFRALNIPEDKLQKAVKDAKLPKTFKELLKE